MGTWRKRAATAVCREQRRHAGAARPAALVAAAPGVARVSGPLLSRKRGTLAAADAARLARDLTALHLPHVLAEQARLARDGSAARLDYRRYLLRLAACEVAARERRRSTRLIRIAGFPTAAGARDGDPRIAPALANGGYIARGENVIALGGAGAGKTRLLVALGEAACRRGLSVRYATAAALADELVAAFEARRLLVLHRRLDKCQLLIVDDLGAAPLSPAGAALLFEVFSRRAERRSTIVASRLPPIAWIRVFGTARLSDAVLERLAYRLNRIDLGGVEPLPWAATDHRRPAWREEPLAGRVAVGSGRPRHAAVAAARSA